MTNGEKIRQLPDEELVELLFQNGLISPPGRNCLSGCEWDSCRDCWIAYLNEEAEEE